MTETKHTTTKGAIVLALLCTIFIATGQLFYKLGSEKIIDVISFFNFFVIIGIFSYFLGSILYILALKKGELSVILPLLALNYVWVALLSIIFLGEIVTLLRWAGISSVVIGVIIIGTGGGHGY